MNIWRYNFRFKLMFSFIWYEAEYLSIFKEEEEEGSPKMYSINLEHITSLIYFLSTINLCMRCNLCLWMKCIFQYCIYNLIWFLGLHLRPRSQSTKSNFATWKIMQMQVLSIDLAVCSSKPLVHSCVSIMWAVLIIF